MALLEYRPRSWNLRGGFKNRPQRKAARSGEPVVTSALGEPPEQLSDDAKSIWREAAAHGTVWLTGADRLQVEIVAQLMAEFRAGDMPSSKVSILVGALNKLGFGPTERSKIKAPQAKEPQRSPFEGFNQQTCVARSARHRLRL